MTHMKKPFEKTEDGCKKATAYLKKIGKYQEFLNNPWSLDGFYLVHFANTYLLRENK